MSEFTTGVLYPRRYESKLIKQLPDSKQPYFHKRLNDEWNVFFLEDEWVQTAETLQYLLDLSKLGVALLWFHDAEDSGWGFRLFEGGYEVSSATISYILDMELAEIEMKRRYPDLIDPDDYMKEEDLRKEYDELIDTIITSQIYRQEVQKGLSRCKPQLFRSFLSPKQIQQLHSLFDTNILVEIDYETGSSLLYDSVDLFKEILGIEEMMWVNYSYLASGGRDSGLA
ncbi:hypothetical protein GOP56_11520 [Brevibacillus sp. 7WMA2]|uniref:Uncharacterized protein n=1 Tax=Brevibacillus laterosporus LMG 15441 TaxID=1042163 RepID=A0A075R880_BRELA|nr:MULTISPECIES: hypothetical protein [Brevibacillus]HAS02112.1 hypothetical protein [Brevibacillus sp.]AIG28064.1 hypothetical protein BRLA_c037640 [Brevibacillus laterosporus LMG 15441]AUM66453.1 hypothetical protein C0R09_19070 [Brevibacillus laterosporus]AYK05328.1 hypothetical protein D8Z77_02245 [Brevibacillus laterosporus]MBA4534164.1 hypothetical protein [Brevibacillus halotolerans]